MSLDAQSNEFSRLVTAWLNETATPEEAAQLWQAVADSADCARAFAAAARFESLLAETVQERAGEKAVLKRAAASTIGFAGLTKSTTIRGGNHTRAILFRAAAVLTVLGLSTWLLWPKSEVPPIAQLTPPKTKAATVVSRPQTPPMQRPPLVASKTAGHSSAVEMPLPSRLDRFFLAGVTLDQTPLHEAMGILQGQLHELNFLNAEALKKLRVTVPADAANRRISFHSGPIAFLKAVRAIAALGGCDVTVDEPTLALILHRETFPQVPERRDVLDILAGRTNTDGSDAASDPDRVAELVADAASLGIAVDPALALDQQKSVPVTRGQWTALQMLTDSRDQLSRFPTPNYQLYLTNGEPNKTNPIIDEQSVAEMRKNFQQSGIQPIAVLASNGKAVIGVGNQTSGLPSVNMQPLGELTQLTLSVPYLPKPGFDEPSAATSQLVLATAAVAMGQGLSATSVPAITGSAFSAAGTITLLPIINSASPP